MTPERRLEWSGASRSNAISVWAKLDATARRNRTLPGRRAASVAHPTNIERLVGEVLDALNVEYLPQYPIGEYVVDFFVPSKRLVIEADGEYFHVVKQGAIERDAQRDAYMTSLGLCVLRLPGRVITSGKAAAILADRIAS